MNVCFSKRCELQNDASRFLPTRAVVGCEFQKGLKDKHSGRQKYTRVVGGVNFKMGYKKHTGRQKSTRVVYGVCLLVFTELF